MIFVGIGTALVLVYIFFIKSDQPTADLVSSASSTVPGDAPVGQELSIAQDFLTFLLSVKNIKLDASIFSDNAFNNLHDSTIILVPEGNEGRPNPFAPIGTDDIEASTGTSFNTQ